MKKKLAILTALATLFLVPHFSFARERTLVATPTKATKGNFCTSVDQSAGTLQKNIGEKETQYSTKEAQQQSALDNKLAKLDTDRQNSRFTWDNSRDKVYALLSERAETDAEKAALLKFKSTIDAAVETRRVSVDKAALNFKTKVDQLVEDRKNAVASATLDFKTEASTALITAKTNCAGGMAQADARALYLNSLTTANESLKEKLAQVKDNGQLRTLVAAQQAGIAQATKEFKATVLKAEETLKKAFPKA